MQPLFIEPTEDTPKVVFDTSTSIFEFSGRSLPEDSIAFFSPINTWINKYVENPNPVTIFNIRLEYFNSSSASKIVKLLIQLEAIKEASKEIRVYWFYEKGDHLMHDRGEEIESILDLDFELQEVED